MSLGRYRGKRDLYILVININMSTLKKNYPLDNL